VSFFSQRLLEGERLGGDAETGAVDAEDYRQFLVGLMEPGQVGEGLSAEEFATALNLPIEAVRPLFE